MFALDLFNTDHERRLAEGAVDQLEQRRIDDLAMKMDDLVARAKEPAYKKNLAALAALMKEFQKCKAERDSYYKVRNETMGYGSLGEGQMKQEMHKAAERMTLTQFINRYGDEEWIREFWNNVNGPMDEAGIPGNVPTEKIPGKEDLLKGKGRSYYEGTEENDDWYDANGRPNPRGAYDVSGNYYADREDQDAGYDAYKERNQTSEATGDSKFDAMMGKISKDPWTQLNSDPNWQYEIEELVDQQIEPWLLAMEKSGMPITRDEETLNPGWRKRYEQVANKLAQEFLTSRGLNPRDPDLVGKIRYAIDDLTDQSRNVHGQLSAYSDLPMQRYADAFDADGMTANIRDAMVGFIRTDDDDDDEPPTRPMPDNDPRRLDPGNMEEGQDETVLDKYKERVGTLGNLQKDNERYQDWRDSHHAVATNFHRNQQRRHDADTDDKIERMAINRDRLRQNDADWKDTFDMMRDRINRYQWSSQGSVDPKKLKKISSIKYQPTREEAENAISTDAKGRTQQQWIKLVQAKFPTAKIMQAKMIDGPVFATLPDGRKISWKKVETSNNQKKNSSPVKEHGGGIGPQQHWQDLMQERKLAPGDPVIVTAPNEFEGKTGEIYDFAPSGTFVIVNLYNHGKHSMHLSDIEYNQYADDQEQDDWYDEGVAEGWSDAMVARRTGSPRTPYSVYIKGKKWKDFENDDHARAVMDKLKAKFKAEGRDPETITIAPTDIPEGVNEGLLYSGDTWQDVLYRINVLNDIFGDQKDLAASFEPASQPEWGPFRDRILRSRTVLDTYAKVKQLANMNVSLTDVEIEMLDDVAWDGGGGPVEPAGHWGERDYDWLEDLYAQQFAVVQHLLDQRAQGHGQNKTKSGQTVHEQGVAETALNPRDPQGDYEAKRKALHDLSLNKDVDQQAVLQRRLDLDREANSKKVAEAQTDYQKRRQRERDVDAGRPVKALPKNPQTDYARKRAQDKRNMELGEDQDTSGVERAILNRIMVAHTDLLMKFGPEKVMQAAEEVAYNVGDVDEIGTSDVSAYVHQVKQILGVPEELDEKWSQKYKSSINCASPKGFSQKAHCAGKKK